MVAHLNYTAEDLLVLLKTMEVSYDCLQNKLVISPLRTHSTIRNEAYIRLILMYSRRQLLLQRVRQPQIIRSIFCASFDACFYYLTVTANDFD